MKSLVITALSLALSSGCGSKDEKKADPPVITYATLKVENSTSTTDNGSVALTRVDACAKNADSGLLTMTLGAADQSSLSIKVRDFKASAPTYSCKQAANNQTDENSVGDKYETCSVYATILAAKGSTKINGYSMYRETTATKPFAYSGTCSIAFTDFTPTVKGTVTCTKMVQTLLESAARNPIQATTTADVTATAFSCTL